MRLALVNPRTSSTRAKGLAQHLVNFYRVTFPALAAHLPEDVAIRVYEENVEDVDFDDPVDLVGITVLTPGAPRAVALTEEFHRRGVPVVWGGIHPTVMPAWSKQYADAIVRGPGELVFEQVLEDAARGSLLPEYHGAFPVERRLPRREILRGKSLFSFATVETSRGCPRICDYCSVPVLNEGRFHTFDLDDVVGDISSLSGRYVFFVDDNLFANPRYTKELFRRIAVLGKTWLAQAPVTIADDSEMLSLATHSGCGGLYLGLESVNEESLREAHKRQKPDRYLDAISKIQDAGISVEAGFVFGFDNDDRGIFDRTLEFINRSRIDSVNGHILTPYPGTPLYERIVEEGRLLHQVWADYNTGNVVFQPTNFSPEGLQEAYDNFHREAHSLTQIARRAMHSNNPFYTLTLNLANKLR